MSTKIIENKLKRIFSVDQKEKLITNDGKRNLYFDRNRQYYIKFTLDVKTTCQTIKKIHNEEINKKLKEIYGEKVDLNNFSFMIVELMANKFEGKIPFVDLKINSDETRLFNILQNTQLMLCYLPINLHNNSLKKYSKNIIKTYSFRTDLYDLDRNIYKTKKENNIEVFLAKTIIHYYNDKKKSFSKEKIKITEKGITIYAKKDRYLLIKDIVNINNSNENEKNDADIIYKDYAIIGEKPKFCIEIKTVNERMLIGRNTYEHFVTLSKAIESATLNYKNNFIDENLNKKIIEENNDLLATNKFIAQNCMTIHDLVINRDKRKIILQNLQDQNLANIINNLMEFKSNCKNKKYDEAINNIKMILEIINERIGKDKLVNYEKIINKENIDNITEIYNKINIIRNEKNNDNKEEDENIINQIINTNIFDNLFIQIKEEYLSKYFDESNSNNQAVHIYNIYITI